MNVVIWFLIIVGTVLAVPINTNNSNRIVGGTDTTVETYPFMVNMQFYYDNQGIWSLRCAATILSARALLSAAHCYVTSPLPSTWRARVGATHITEGGLIHAIESIKNHELYNREPNENDIAVLKVATPFTLSDKVAVARISGPFYNLPDNTVVTAIGWGRLESGGALPENLQHVDFNTINQEECVARYKWLQTQPLCQAPGTICPDVLDGMLCTGILDVGGKDSCQGDSGGPVVYAGNIVVGVTSWGLGCADAYFPGVNARVSYYSNWISVNAAQL